MTPEQFTYWLKGFFEISEVDTLSAKQVTIIDDHLQLVFDKQTPNRRVTTDDLPEILANQFTCTDKPDLIC